jgi:hypothetical protein
MRFAPALLALILLAAACGGESSPTGPDGPVLLTQVYKDASSGLKAQGAEIVSREERWAEVWDQIVAGRSPKPAIPNVDFNQRILIVAALGETADSCKSVEVESVTRRDGALDIVLAEVRPPANCSCPPVVVQPVHVVSVTRAATDATFTWHNVTRGSCN